MVHGATQKEIEVCLKHATYCTSITLMERRQRKALRGIQELKGSDESETKKGFC